MDSHTTANTSGDGGKLTLLTRGLLNLGGESVTDLAISGLELLQALGGIVDESEASGLSATKVGAETKD